MSNTLLQRESYQADQRRSFMWALPSQSPLEYAIRSNDWKLLLDAQQQPRALFDLATDPLELFNLIKQQPQLAIKLHQLFLQELSAIESDPLLQKNSMSRSDTVPSK
jgi:arylsulfatase A-like enzyme